MLVAGPSPEAEAEAASTLHAVAFSDDCACTGVLPSVKQSCADRAWHKEPTPLPHQTPQDILHRGHCNSHCAGTRRLHLWHVVKRRNRFSGSPNLRLWPCPLGSSCSPPLVLPLPVLFDFWLAELGPGMDRPAMLSGGSIRRCVVYRLELKCLRMQ